MGLVRKTCQLTISPKAASYKCSAWYIRSTIQVRQLTNFCKPANRKKSDVLVRGDAPKGSNRDSEERTPNPTVTPCEAAMELMRRAQRRDNDVKTNRINYNCKMQLGKR